jgi:hypothetical protein
VDGRTDVGGRTVLYWRAGGRRPVRDGGRMCTRTGAHRCWWGGQQKPAGEGRRMGEGGRMVVGGCTVLYWLTRGRRPARVCAPSIVGVPSHCRTGSWCFSASFPEFLQERELSVSTIFEQPVVFFVTLKTTHGTPADSVAHRWPRSFRNRFRLFNLGFQFLLLLPILPSLFVH